MLTGKKTYIAALATILGAVAAALSETMTWGDALALIVPAVLGMTLRAGVTAEAARAAPKAVVPLLLSVLALAGCASPGQEQGSSKNESPSMNITVIVAGPGTTIPGKDGAGAVSVINTSSPAAAPNASAQQDAAASVEAKAGVGDKALDAVTAGAASAATGVKKIAEKAAEAVTAPTEPTPATDPTK